MGRAVGEGGSCPRAGRAGAGMSSGAGYAGHAVQQEAHTQARFHLGAQHAHANVVLLEIKVPGPVSARGRCRDASCHWQAVQGRACPVTTDWALRPTTSLLVQLVLSPGL